MVPIAAISSRHIPTVVASRQPLLIQPMNATATTTRNQGNHSRKSRIGSRIQVTRKSLIAWVPPMIGTPLRRLSCTHFTAVSMGDEMSKVSHEGKSVMSSTRASTTAPDHDTDAP